MQDTLGLSQLTIISVQEFPFCGFFKVPSDEKGESEGIKSDFGPVFEVNTLQPMEVAVHLPYPEVGYPASSAVLTKQ